MVRYRRNLVPGATFLFTLALADRRSDALIRHVDELRESFRVIRSKQPFDIDAIIVLPEHLHAVLTLPAGDADFPVRWRLIRTNFTKLVCVAGLLLDARDATGRDLWQRRYWEHTIRDDADFSRHVDYIHYNAVKHGHVARPVD